MDVDTLMIKSDSNHRLTGDAVASAVDDFHNANSKQRIFAIVATAGTTNLGVIDDLEGIGRVANERSIWYHVDGAYGLAALASPKTRPLFHGVERADSLIVDPHKWLFAPFDACEIGRAHV